MPITGGISAPKINVLKALSKGDNQGSIDTGNYIEISTDPWKDITIIKNVVCSKAIYFTKHFLNIWIQILEQMIDIMKAEMRSHFQSKTPNARIYFTTDGSDPKPWKKNSSVRNRTFTYKAPFALRPGRRTVKAMAIHNVTNVESHVVTRKFNVLDLNDPKSDREDIYTNEDDDEDDDVQSNFSGRSRQYEEYNRAIVKRPDFETSDDLVDSFIRRNADQGFAATNHSGTQINLWGQVPGLNWDVRGPNSSNIYGSYISPLGPFAVPNMHSPYSSGMDNAVNPQQLSAIASHLTQCIDQTRHMTVTEVRELMKQLLDKAMEKQIPNPSSKPLLPISQGSGDIAEQIEHIKGHLIDYSHKDPDFADAIADARMGTIVSADFDEDENTFLLTVQLRKPGATNRRRKSKRPANDSPNVSQLKEPVPKSEEHRKTPTKPTTPKSDTNAKSKVPTKSDNEDEDNKDISKPEDTLDKSEKESPKKTDEKDYVPDYETIEIVYEPTIKPAPNFDCESDCERLKKAMHGLGTDEKVLIEIMANRSADQRAQIVSRYKSLFGKSLVDKLKSETSRHFKATLEALCYTLTEYDARELRRAVEGAGTDEQALIEILCTRTNKQLRDIKQCYSEIFKGRDLEKDIINDTSRHFKRLLVAILQANRDESPTFDRNAARRDAEDLYRAGEQKLGTDQSRFIAILGSRSYAHLRGVFEEYEKISKKTIEAALKSEMHGDMEKAVLAIVGSIMNKPKFFAAKLFKSMKGAGTDDRTLIRIIVSRSEIDLGRIKKEFLKENAKTLEAWVHDDTTGDYRKLLLALVNGNCSD